MPRTRDALMVIAAAGGMLFFGALLYVDPKVSEYTETQAAVFVAHEKTFDVVVAEDDTREKNRESMVQKLSGIFESNADQERSEAETIQSADTASVIFTESEPASIPEEEFFIESFPPPPYSRSTTTLGTTTPNTAAASTTASSSAFTSEDMGTTTADAESQ